MRDATEIICVIDKSGSMSSCKGDAIGGFNTFLEEQQKQPGEANITVVLFDTEHTIWPACPLKHCPKFSDSNYRPGGNTALLDALGEVIYQTGERLKGMKEEERPDKIIVVIVTDGQENSSSTYNKDQIASMVKHQQEKYNWKFIYLGANVDAFHEAQMLGIDGKMSSNFRADIGTRSAFVGATYAVSDFRAAGEIDDDWKKDVKN